MACADIAACFRIQKIVPELTGAFGFMITPMGLYFLATAMVFGSLISAACWEPMRRAIEVMTAVILPPSLVMQLNTMTCYLR